METHKVLFKVSLSNGETFYEGKPPFDNIPEQPSPWQRLIRYTVDKKVFITSLALYTKDGRTFNLPSLGKNPKFKAFLDAEKPIDYQVFRKISREMDVIPEDKNYKVGSVQVDEWFTCVEAIYSSYRLQVWVSEQDPRNSWVLVV